MPRCGLIVRSSFVDCSLVCCSGVVTTVPNTSGVKQIGHWIDEPNGCEWLVTYDGKGCFEYRNLTPENKTTRNKLVVGDGYTDGAVTMGVHPCDGRIVYYDSAGGISITANTGTSDIASSL